jgi:hypothetical protein
VSVFFEWRDFEGAPAPFISLALAGQPEPIPLSALFDSGATVSVLPSALQGELGVPDSLCRPTRVNVFGPTPIDGLFTVIEAQMVSDEGLTTNDTEGPLFDLPLIFADVRFPVYGRAGILDHFTVLLDATARTSGCTWDPGPDDWIAAIAARAVGEQAWARSGAWWAR